MVFEASNSGQTSAVTRIWAKRSWIVEVISLRWKACVVVTEQTVQYLGAAVNSLKAAGFDGIDLFAPRGVSLSDSDSVIRQRCEAKLTEPQLFATAIKSVGRSFIRDIDLVIVMRADVALWQSAKLLMEGTIEPGFVGVYFPMSPRPFFLGNESHIPCQRQLGWCEVDVDEPVSGASCVAFNKHTAALLSGWMGDIIADRRPNHGWDYQLSLTINDLDLVCYAAARSLAWYQNANESDLDDCVPAAAKLNPKFAERNMYLN